MQRRKLTVDEYLIESENWFKNNGKYYEELVSINRKESYIVNTKFNGISDLYLESDDAIILEKERAELRKKYKGYIDVYYDTDFYCLLTSENVDKLINDRDDLKKHLLSDLELYRGKLMTDGYEGVGIFEGIAVCLDDFYYILRDTKNNSSIWCSCVGNIYPHEPEKEKKSYTMVTNGQDYL